ncbi:hypothetical protein FE782_02650 [Paenibacillus antri]|uniref:Uncharacterized protein n=1 Tax=Paenibacillus antri TaxID=2582848 RepID=A0A5R9GCQ7_9BACL|nr:hypothetical protein [Paenibacillus antri]TLS54262.1 hypothetical protein FE782_02650 [Paenibacillus antri]
MENGLNRRDRHAIRDWIDTLSVAPGAGNRKAPALGYPLLGAGKHRFVFDIGDGRILKVARVPKGIDCNAQEASLYRRAPSALRKHLCPVTAAGHGWVVMKKMTRPVPSGRVCDRQLKRVRELADRYGIAISDIVDRRTGRPRRNNVRLAKDGRVVLIDYANVYAERNQLVAFFRRAFGR